ncbi:acetyl-CoA carboxylase biotin carboxyl carrier protein [Pseudoflavonifractor sp. MSJ-37]|uniref:acetyl-CoA carboxylase biotin carboxyl carrier protein n=1 Tax=Pseudoflavonifractor sp. MSJ-37 TaxID=2841531 RepID=UPI001C127850|nr:acetyl-CoA carboxylase biotin carboxyl carrier protein [Pseudoflavonifractor sp. MSJ-37]MBU5436170.1 acetyl-CoA carboxylase biotin carboxyl carrier protein [Pseudoflavonifractor sp. MSJ-37]
MELSDIFALMDRFERGSIQRFELEQEDLRLVLDKTVPAAVLPVQATPAPLAQPAAPAAPEEAPAQSEGPVVKAPLVGTFYAAASPDAAPFAPVGAAVKKGDTLCILEAMKMMSEVPSPMDGVIAEVLVSDGELVGFDQPLFRFK